MKRLLIAVICLASLGCTVSPRNSKLSSETTWELNTASQLQQMDQDYRTFFHDLNQLAICVPGKPPANCITTAERDSMYANGRQFRTAYEHAVREFTLWRQTHDGTTKQLVITLVLEAERILLDLTTRKQTVPTPTPVNWRANVASLSVPHR